MQTTTIDRPNLPRESLIFTLYFIIKINQLYIKIQKNPKNNPNPIKNQTPPLQLPISPHFPNFSTFSSKLDTLFIFL
jgi:hypothetical protein